LRGVPEGGARLVAGSVCLSPWGGLAVGRVGAMLSVFKQPLARSQGEINWGRQICVDADLP
jgi:hypothetical protein